MKRWQQAPSYVGESRAAYAPRRTRLAKAGDVYDCLGDIRAATAEHFIVFDMTVRHTIIQRRVVAIGTLTGVEVAPREVFKDAILNSAAAIIVAHNHPSGDASPSRQDIELTKRLRDAGELLGIKLLDHVVVVDGGFTSMAEQGHLL